MVIILCLDIFVINLALVFSVVATFTPNWILRYDSEGTIDTVSFGFLQRCVNEECFNESKHVPSLY